MTLRALFAPIFAQVLLLTRAPAAQRQSYPDVRARVAELLKTQHALALARRVSMRDYDDAEFAMVVWIDEIILRTAKTDKHTEFVTEWQRRLLQKEYYDIEIGGEDFYKKLGQLRPEQSPVREIYYLCLRLGFRGMYKELNQEPQFSQICRRYAQQLPIPMPDWERIEENAEYLVEQPYRVAQPVVQKRDWFLWSGIVVTVLALVVGHFYLQPLLHSTLFSA